VTPPGFQRYIAIENMDLGLIWLFGHGASLPSLLPGRFNDMMTSIAPYVASPFTITIVIIGLIAWTGSSGYSLLAATNKLRFEVIWARTQIEAADNASAFAARYESIAQELGDNVTLGPRWREYQHSLWISDGGMVRVIGAKCRAPLPIRRAGSSP
jgi:hypothetical protein